MFEFRARADATPLLLAYFTRSANSEDRVDQPPRHRFRQRVGQSCPPVLPGTKGESRLGGSRHGYLSASGGSQVGRGGNIAAGNHDMPIGRGCGIETRIDPGGQALVDERCPQLSNGPGRRRGGGDRIPRVHDDGYTRDGALKAVGCRDTCRSAGMF